MSSKIKILVTGGAGYIGSHVVKALGERGYEVLTYDNLSYGHEDAVLYGKLIVADLSDRATLRKTFEEFKSNAVKTALGKRPYLEIYGTDYPTKDGTCIRDYIHVDDLAEAHILALEYLFEEGRSEIFNCGYGHGYSVREVVEATKKVSGVDFKVIEAARREGDPPELVANSSKIKKTLGWIPKYDNLEYIIKTAYEWERKLP